MNDKIEGMVYVLEDNIDTDQIIPAEWLTWDPSIPAERLKLGGKALTGLPEVIRKLQPFLTDAEREAVAIGAGKTRYNIIIAGRGFGCGSSREHAPNSLGAAGVNVVIAKGYARIFFENSVATGELLPTTSRDYLVDRFRTGDRAEVDLVNASVTNISDGARYDLEPLGYILPMVRAGGLFAYARQKGLIPQRPLS